MAKWRRNRSLPRRWQRHHLVNKYGNNCFLCGEPMTMHEITIDHWIPLSKGGLDDLPNYRLAHDKCNSLKASLSPEEYQAFQAGSIQYE